MNRLAGKISHIESQEALSLVSVAIGDYTFKSIVIETPDTADYLVLDGNVWVYFKETEVIIAREITSPISLRNRIPSQIENIQKGKLLSKLTLDSAVGQIQAIITTSAVEQLDLSLKMPVVAMIKTNELMLSP